MKAITFLLCLSVLCLSEGSGSDKVRLQDGTPITLYAGKTTIGGRAVPQIECVGWCPISEPRIASCVNRGLDGNNIQWECKADLEEGFEFDNVDVQCEGNDYSNDPYILQGSCGLKYTLRASPKTKKTPYTHENTREQPSPIKDLIRALNKTYISPATNYTRTDKSSSDDAYPVTATSEPQLGWNILGFGSYLAAGCPGCIDCVNCPNSSGCIRCTNCYHCQGSVDCSNCSNCNGSIGCTNCNNCNGCINCHNLNNCTGCINQ